MYLCIFMQWPISHLLFSANFAVNIRNVHIFNVVHTNGVMESHSVGKCETLCRTYQWLFVIRISTYMPII